MEYKAQEVSSGEHPGDRGYVYHAQQQGAGHWLACKLKQVKGRSVNRMRVVKDAGSEISSSEKHNLIN